MKLKRRSFVTARRVALALASMAGLACALSATVNLGSLVFGNSAGAAATYSLNGSVDLTNPFFQSLGTNGRSCGTCHLPQDAFGLSAQSVRARFKTTNGTDPLFASVDGANCPGANPGDPSGHSLLLGYGLIRVSLPVPGNAEFTIRPVHDPYGCASGVDPASGLQVVSVYRRPLPSTNLSFISAVMADGRETVQPLNDPQTFGANLVTDLAHQALDATLTHAQALSPPTQDQLSEIVAFELGLFSAQIYDRNAGLLSAHGAAGGPAHLAAQVFYPGINDSLGHDPKGGTFNSSAFTIFSPWALPPSATSASGESRNASRRQIAAGEALFNSRPLTIAAVRGLNDNVSLAHELSASLPIAPFQGTCTTCHNTPNVGNHSFPLPLDIGTVHDPNTESDPQIAAGLSELSPPDLPVFAVTGCPNPFPNPLNPGAPFVIYTTDPGKALISGLCSDLNRTKGPILRGLAARAPYFHNGAARDLKELVSFYNRRFQMNLTETEKAQLIAFLNSL